VAQDVGTLVRALQRPSKGAWSASARALGSDGSVTATAYCGKGKALSEHSGSKPLPADSGAVVNARCPKGTSVRLDGFLLKGGIDEPVLAGLERTSERTVRLTALSRSINAKHAGAKAQAIAYCGKGPKLAEVDDTVSLGNQTSPNEATATATCAPGDKLAMGGYRASAFDGRGPFVDRFERGSGQSWRVSAFGFSEAGPKAPAKITAIAYCKPG
jgi:hypothetical protein